MKALATASFLTLLIISLSATALPALATPAQDSIQVNLVIRDYIATTDPGTISFNGFTDSRGPAQGAAFLSAASNSVCGFAIEVAGDETSTSCQQSAAASPPGSSTLPTAPLGAADNQAPIAGPAINFKGARELQVVSADAPASRSATVHFEAAGGCQSTLVATFTSI